MHTLPASWPSFSFRFCIRKKSVRCVIVEYAFAKPFWSFARDGRSFGPQLNEGLKTIVDPLRPPLLPAVHASLVLDLLEKVVGQAVTGMSFQPCPRAAARGSRHFRFHTVLFLRYRTTYDAYARCASQSCSA
jgi:hypothetical protein